MTTTNIHGYPIEHEDNDSIIDAGIYYLQYILSYEEVSSLCENARLSGQIKFEDRSGNNFVLIHIGGGCFRLEKRSDSGW